MMYSFAKPEAVRSFRESWKRDPNCAICYWGEAWAWGSYLNAPMTAEEAPHAYEAMQKAIGLKAKADPKERALIEAMSVRYVQSFDANKRVEQDRAYRDAMSKVASTYPDDLDIATLYADSLFLLEPRRGSRDVKDPNVQHLHHVLEAILAKNVHHPGACHLYVHATESTVAPGKAEDCAQFLGSSIPGASHINHMPSHTWNEVGRWARLGPRQSRGVAFRSEGVDRGRVRDLSGAQPAHAALCRLDGRSGRDRDAGRAKTTRS